jgi:predicted RNA-binding Zn ribbon-like protein
LARQPDAAELVDRAHALRASLYGYLTERGGRRARTAALAQAVEIAQDARRFRVRPDGGRWELPETLELPLQAIALAIADLLAGGELGRIGRCPGHDCGWLFLSHRARRWCSMASCGNRAKVRAHAARQRDRSSNGSGRAGTPLGKAGAS